MAILIGIGAGLAGAFLLLQKANFLLSNLLAGITGSLVGLVFYAIFLRSTDGALFAWPSAVSSAICAWIAVMGFNGLTERSGKKVTHKDLDTSQEDVEQLSEEA